MCVSLCVCVYNHKSDLVRCPLRSRPMDRCVMKKMASAKTHPFFTMQFYSHHPSPRISIRLVIRTGIQWTTLLITEEDERVVNNSTGARTERKGKRGGGVNHREKRWRAESSENRSPERIRTVRYREEKKKMKDTQDEDMTSSKRGEGLIITERLWRMWGGNTSAPASQLLRDILSSLYMTPTADLWIHAVN